MSFVTPLDIANRALQYCGRKRVFALTDSNPNAAEINFCYDKLRLVELQRNLWRFSTRRVILRALGIDSVLWTPPAWASGTAYSAGAVVSVTPSTGPYAGTTLYFIAQTADSPSTLSPELNTSWRLYTGPLAIDLYNTGITSTNSPLVYNTGELVIVPAIWSSTVGYVKNQVVALNNIWYVALATSFNQSPDAPSSTFWVAWTGNGRAKGAFGQTATNSPIPLTYPGATIASSLFNNNADNPYGAGATNWLGMGGTFVPLQIAWPIGAGPSHDTKTKNVFRLPNGWLKRAPSDPHAGQIAYLGASSGAFPEDWVLEDTFLVTGDSGPLMLRFIANLLDVPLMDPMFCEGLAARIALEVVDSLTDKEAVTKKPAIQASYRRAITEARMTNAIEVGPIAEVENRYITVRV